MNTRPGNRLVALDMDGVVVDGMQYHARAWQDVFISRLGITLPAVWVYEWEGVPGDQFLELVSTRLDAGFSQSLVAELHQLKQERFEEIFEITPIDGIYETIEWLLNAGYPLALVTGTERPVALQVLSRLGLNSAFSHLVSGNDVPRGKPFPDPYLRAASLAHCSPPNCLVIENAPAGIESALQAGMTCAALRTSLDAAFLKSAHCILPSHADLRAVLAAEHVLSGGLGSWQISAACASA